MADAGVGLVGDVGFLVGDGDCSYERLSRRYGSSWGSIFESVQLSNMVPSCHLPFWKTPSSLVPSKDLRGGVCGTWLKCTILPSRVFLASRLRVKIEEAANLRFLSHTYSLIPSTILPTRYNRATATHTGKDKAISRGVRADDNITNSKRQRISYIMGAIRRGVHK